MATAMIRPGVVMLRAPGNHVALAGALRSSGGTPVVTYGTLPSAVSGIAGWWDAGALSGMNDSSGNPIAAWNLPIASLTDKSGAGVPMTVFHAYSGTAPPMATPRLNGLLGGLGLTISQTSFTPYTPVMDFDTGMSVPATNLGSATAWTWYFVWSRPNWWQNIYGSASTSPVTLLSTAGTPVLQADAVMGAGDRLVLFPGSGQVVLTSSLARRHTHSIIIRNTPGVGVDVWLDDVQVASAATNPLAAGTSGALLLLHSGASQGSAQCWFHEAATWHKALSSGEITTLLSAATRWTRGTRMGVSLVINGQSNASRFISAGYGTLMAQGVAWYLGALAYNQIAREESGAPGTIVSGEGIYTIEPYESTFLIDPGDGSSPSGWSMGAMGNNVSAYIAGLSAADQADIGALVVLWSETDSYRPYSEKAKYTLAARRWLSLFRAMVPGASVANLPIIWWNAIPFGNTDGIQMQRETVQSIAADASMNVTVGLPMTADSNSYGATWDPTTGLQTGGDNQHRDLGDDLIFAQRAAPVIARAMLAAGKSDTLSTLPAGLPAVGGPVISHAWMQTTTSVVLTVIHDAGTDLVVALQALNGAGFLVMDGGSVASPGTLQKATACARIDATHLLITLAGALTNPAASCLLFYPYGSYNPAGAPTYRGDMGRGNAVTDNFASLVKPTGWDIAGDLGSSWSLNYPLAATTTPIALSSTAT